MNAFLLCCAKDWREVVRDRRAMVVQVVLPIVLYPLLFLVVGIAGKEAMTGGNRPVRIGVIGSPELVARLSASAAVRAEILAPDWLDERLHTSLSATTGSLPPGLLAAMQSASFAAVVTVIPSAPLQVHIAIDHGHVGAASADEAIRQTLQRWGIDRRDALLAAAGISASQAAIVISRDAPGGVASVVKPILGWIAPLLLALFAASAAAVVAADLVAGARERGTRDWAWTLPISRRTQVAATIATVATTALIAALANVVSLLISVLAFGGSMAHIPVAAGVQAVAPVIPVLLIAIVPTALAIGAGAVVFASGAASAREANANLVPLLLAVMALAGVAAWPSFHSGGAIDVIPISGVLLAVREALQSPTIPWLSLAIGTVSTFAAAGFGWLTAVALAEREAGSLPRGTPSAGSAVMVFLLALSAYLLLSGMVAGARPMFQVAVPQVFALGAIPLLALVVLRWRPAALGLRRPEAGNGPMIGALMVIAPLISVLSGVVQQVFVSEAATNEIEKLMRPIFDGIYHTGGIPLLILLIGVVPGWCEEFLCRGVLLHGLVGRFGRPTAMVISATIFAAMHLSPARFLPQFILGLLLGWLALRTKSIYPGVFIHAWHNGLLITVSYTVAAPH